MYLAKYTWEGFLGQASIESIPNGSARSHAPRPDWDLGVGLDGALRLAREGWTEGLSQVSSTALATGAKIGERIERINWRHDVEPSNLDVARFLDGEPECWLVPEMSVIAGQGRLLLMVVDGFTSSRISGEDIVRRGAVCLAVARLLEEAGHSVRIEWELALAPHQGQPAAAVLQVPIKDWGDPLNPGRLAFVLMHPAMLRRLAFSVMESFPPGIRKQIGVPNGGYGNKPPVTKRGDIYIPGMSSTDKIQDAGKWAEESLLQCGIHLRPGQ